MGLAYFLQLRIMPYILSWKPSCRYKNASIGSIIRDEIARVKYIFTLKYQRNYKIVLWKKTNKIHTFQQHMRTSLSKYSNIEYCQSNYF